MTHHPSRRLATLLRRFGDFWRDRRGVAAVEMALTVSLVLLPLCACLIVAGQALETQYRLTRAMHAGFMYAWRYPTDPNLLTNTQAAVQAAYGPTTLATNAASPVCFCIPPNGTLTQATSSFQCSQTTCPSGTPANYIKTTWLSVVVAQNYSPLFTFPYLPTQVTSGGTARVQ